eukprot:7904139-Karenia_brevis.AAC.1
MVNAISKPAPPWWHLYDIATPDHGVNNPWFGSSWDRKRMGKISRPLSLGDIPNAGDNYLMIDCT